MRAPRRAASPLAWQPRPARPSMRTRSRRLVPRTRARAYWRLYLMCAVAGVTGGTEAVGAEAAATGRVQLGRRTGSRAGAREPRHRQLWVGCGTGDEAVCGVVQGELGSTDNMPNQTDMAWFG
ncbi:hypothetical protein GUJ93_ZPchr0011g27841 [Zizania palustris]|uniref:Uncharacterized protein n=1 Tax=Zizania palustris TaxID=103762 RepID=A0A8J5WJT7_ZIZPA|nr:hypothetical protein GUJ93_ZPchr0011g27841 [Zizania palustris]